MKILLQLACIYILLIGCDYGKSSSENSSKTSLEIKKSNQPTPVATFERNLNIFVLMSNDSTIQLTFSQTDSLPLIIPNKPYVVFVRENIISGMSSKSLMLVNIFSLKESIVTDKKPFPNQEDSYKLMEIKQPMIMDNGESVMFITDKYAKASQLVKVNISSGEWTDKFTAEWYKPFNMGHFKNHYLVGQSIIRENGYGIYYSLVDDSGNVIKQFKNKESMKDFEEQLSKKDFN